MPAGDLSHGRIRFALNLLSLIFSHRVETHSVDDPPERAQEIAIEDLSVFGSPRLSVSSL